MRRDVEHMRIGFEDVLRAVAVMDVVIDDGDLARAEMTRVGGGDRYIVEQAEAHRARALGVVPRRPHDRDRGPVRSGHHALDAVDGGARREQRDLIRLR